MRIASCRKFNVGDEVICKSGELVLVVDAGAGRVEVKFVVLDEVDEDKREKKCERKVWAGRILGGVCARKLAVRFRTDGDSAATALRSRACFVV